MKKTTFIVAMLFFVFLGTNVYGQSYKSAVGARFGYILTADYKKSVGENKYVDFYAGFYGGGGFHGGVALNINKPIEDVNNLYWYYGAGVFFSAYKYNTYDNDLSTFYGVNAVIGLDYEFEELPLDVSVDWMPGYYFGSYNGFGAYSGGLAVRYILGRS